MFIDFAIFYQYFIQGFSKIATSLTLLLKVIGLSDLTTKVFKFNNNNIVKVRGKANETIVNSFKNNKSRNLMHIPNIRVIGERIFLIASTKNIFNHLRLAFIKAPIF